MSDTSTPLLYQQNDKVQDVEKPVENALQRSLRKAAAAVGVFQIVLLLLYTLTSATVEIDPSAEQFSAAYGLFLGVAIMMHIGFGYLMTFLAFYGMGSVGLTFLITVVGLQWCLFTDDFFGRVYEGDLSGEYSFDMFEIIQALYGVAAVLISFGALIGKLSPYQLVILTIIELVCYSFNCKIFLEGNLKIVDVGGTVIIHMFGAYFGLAVAYVFGDPKAVPREGYVPEMFAFVGTNASYPHP
jgi:hypothetical protein